MSNKLGQKRLKIVNFGQKWPNFGHLRIFPVKIIFDKFQMPLFEIKQKFILKTTKGPNNSPEWVVEFWKSSGTHFRQKLVYFCLIFPKIQKISMKMIRRKIQV